MCREQWLDRDAGVAKTGKRITAIRMLSGRTFRGRVFVDATYEGDLLVAAGVTYHVGREARSQHGEQQMCPSGRPAGPAPEPPWAAPHWAGH